MFDMLQLVVVMSDDLAGTKLESSITRRQAEACRTFAWLSSVSLNSGDLRAPQSPGPVLQVL
jgi:hypothetical protein